MSTNEQFTDPKDIMEITPEREPVPTCPLDQPSYPLTGLGITEEDAGKMPRDTYAVHEGLARIKDGAGDCITLVTPGMVEGWKSRGLVETFAFVPFTGAQSGERTTNPRFVKAEESMLLARVAIEAGVQNIDWGNLTPEKMTELKRLGCDRLSPDGSTIDLFGGRSIRVERAEGEGIEDIAKIVGQYSVAEVDVPGGDLVATVIVLVDSQGNKTITGADKHALGLLQDLGYSRVDEPPFAISGSISTPEASEFVRATGTNIANPDFNIPIRHKS